MSPYWDTQKKPLTSKPSTGSLCFRFSFFFSTFLKLSPHLPEQQGRTAWEICPKIIWNKHDMHLNSTSFFIAAFYKYQLRRASIKFLQLWLQSPTSSTTPFSYKAYTTQIGLNGSYCPYLSILTSGNPFFLLSLFTFFSDLHISWHTIFFHTHWIFPLLPFSLDNLDSLNIKPKN